MNQTDIDSDDRASSKRGRHKPNHHSQQYAKAAGRAVEVALAMLVHEDALPSLLVHEARLDGAVLEILLMAPAVTWDELTALEQRVQSFAPWLRAAIAGELQRKRTPHLRLRLIPGSAPE